MAIANVRFRATAHLPIMGGLYDTSDALSTVV